MSGATIPAPTERVHPLEAAGVGLVTFAGAFGLWSVIYGLGSGGSLSPLEVIVPLAIFASAVLMWRVGPRRVEPLVAGLLLIGVALLLVDLRTLAVLTFLLTAATEVRRVVVRPTTN
jgi:hypothetical protein